MTALALENGQPRTTGRRPRPLTPAQLGLPVERRAAGRRDGLVAHVRATVDAGVRVLLAEQVTAGRADSPESVHQMRVAARRMRVALRMARDELGPAAERLRAELSWLGTLLGEVRDLDVLCERLAAEIDAVAEADLPALREVLDQLDQRRSVAADALGSALGQPRFRALLRALAEVAVEPAEPSTDAGPDELLARPLRALHKAGVGRTPSDEDWHNLRIKVKRVRYAAELAAQLAGRKRRTELAKLAGQAKSAQEVLGAFHDTVVAEDHLRQLVTTSQHGFSPAGLLMLGRLVERQVARRDALRKQLPTACDPLSR